MLIVGNLEVVTLTDVASSLCGEDHIIKGVSVFTSSADPKTKQPPANQGFSGAGPSSNAGGYFNYNRSAMSGPDRGPSGSGWNRPGNSSYPGINLQWCNDSRRN